MIQYKIDQLEKIDRWFWEREITSFKKKYKIVKKWFEKYGRIPNKVKDKSGEEYIACLIYWRFRLQYRNNELTEEQLKKINKIPGWYWNKEEHLLNEFIKWVDDNKRLPMKRKNYKEHHVENRLNQWVRLQKKRYAKGTLPQVTIDKLSNIAGWSWIFKK